MEKVKYTHFDKQEIEIEGYIGTWSEIDSAILMNNDGTESIYHLMEHDECGDETCYLLIDENNKVVCETYDDIECALSDSDLI